MRSKIADRIARAVAGRGDASPESLARVDALLREAARPEPTPPGLRRVIVARLNDEGAPSRAASPRAALLGTWTLVGAACIALALAVLALRTPPARVNPGASGLADAHPTAPDASPSTESLLLVQRRLEAGVRALPARVEAPLADEARRLALDARRAARVVTAAWRPAGFDRATPGAAPVGVPSGAPTAPAGGAPGASPGAGPGGGRLR